jgi:hypothetical protein
VTTERAAVVRVRRLMSKHGPDLLAKLEAGTPLRTALAALQLPADVEGDLADRADVRAALARREEHLRAQLADPDRARRDAALIELRTLHGWREPGTTTVEQRFGAVLDRFREWVQSNPDAKAATTFNALAALLANKKETAAEKRRARRFGSGQ